MIASLVLLVAAISAPPPTVIHFDRPATIPGERVTVSLERVPRRKLVRLYLVATADAERVRSATDPRLHYIGSLWRPGNEAGLTFLVPPLRGRYKAWCAGCGAGGMLVVRMRPATMESCPATVEEAKAPPELNPGVWQGNDSLWTALHPDGVYLARPQDVRADGSIWAKLFWYARVHGHLSLSGRRLDALSPTLVVHRINAGSQTNWDGGTWATPVTFPARGCWRLAVRVTTASSAVSYSFVTKVTP